MQWRKERVESLGSAQSLDWSDSPHRVSRLHSNSSASRSFHALMQWTALECFGCAPSCESPLTSPLAAARYHVLKHSRKYHLQDTSAYVNRVCSRVASRVGTISSREVDACASVDSQARSKATTGSRAAQDHIVARYTLVAVAC